MEGSSGSTQNFWYAPAALFRTDAAGQCLQVNEAWCELTGLSVSASLGAAWLRPVHPDDRERVRRAWERAVIGGAELREEFRLVRQDGSEVWVEARVRRMLDPQGRLEGHLGVLTDISTRKQAQRESLWHREQMRGALATLMDAILIMSSVREQGRIVDFRVIDAGGDLKSITSRSAEEMTGQTFWQLVPSAPDALFQRYVSVVETGELLVEERPQISAGRGDHWVRIKLARMGDGLVLVIKNITEQKRHENELRARERAVAELSSRLNTILDASLEVAIIATTTEGVINLFNRGAERMLGYSASEVLHTTTPAIFHREDEVAEHVEEMSARLGRPVSELEAFTRHAQESSPGREWTYVRKDGSSLQVSLSTSPLLDEQGQIVGYVGIAADITDRVQAARALRQAAEAAEAANRAKSEFLANVSHEIRTPLNGVLGLLELSLSETVERSQHNRLAMAYRSARSLLLILNDLLDFAKIEAGKMKLVESPFRVEDELDRVAQTAAARAQGKRLEFRLHRADSLPAGLIGDADRIRQILENLLDNAIKFTDHGVVTLTASAEPLEGQRVRVTFHVSDTGVGIPREKMTRIFAPFEQADGSSTRRFGGTGLGLTICADLARLMGGSLSVTSVEGEGSCFTLTLCLERGEVTPVHTSMPGSPPLEPLPPLRVLLVEDNRINQIVATKMLERGGHQVKIASKGAEAIEILQEERFDVVLMDVQMPLLDGLETTRRVRSHEADAGIHTPIVGLTARASREDRDMALAAGMDVYLTKPFQFIELDQALRQALALSGQAIPGRGEPPALQAM